MRTWLGNMYWCSRGAWVQWNKTLHQILVVAGFSFPAIQVTYWQELFIQDVGLKNGDGFSSDDSLQWGSLRYREILEQPGAAQNLCIKPGFYSEGRLHIALSFVLHSQLHQRNKPEVLRLWLVTTYLCEHQGIPENTIKCDLALSEHADQTSATNRQKHF